MIPKTDGAKEMEDFRSISMVSCIYKVTAKILARRIRGVMNHFVGESQTAFLQDRKIYDSALIACEVVQWLKKSKKKGAIVMFDFKKAYDSVRWCFVDHVLEKNGIWKQLKGLDYELYFFCFYVYPHKWVTYQNF